MPTPPHAYPPTVARVLGAASHLLVAFLLVASPARADDPAPATMPPPACTRVLTLPASVPAPCSGLLWPEDWSRRALECVSTAQPGAAAAEVAFELDVCRADLKARNDQSEALARTLAACEKVAVRASVAEPVPLWKSPVLWGVVGVVVGAGVVATAWGLAGR